MNLRSKTILVVSITILVATGLLYAHAVYFWLAQFTSLERQTTQNQLERATKIITNQLDHLTVTADDWAAWDDTYTFLVDANQEYIDKNLLDVTYTNLGLNLLLISNTQGQVVFAKAYDLVEDQPVELPGDLTQHLQAGSPLLSPASSGECTHGLLGLTEQTLLVAACPILPSDEMGAIRGVLLMGRTLDDPLIAQVAELAGLTVVIYPLNQQPFPESLQPVVEKLAGEESWLVEARDESTVAGYTLLPDLYAQPALILSIEQPRRIYHQGKQGIQSLVVTLLIFGTAAALICLVILDRLVLGRLARLGKRIQEISASDDLALRLETRGRDELSRLAHLINQMLEGQEKSTYKLSQAMEEMEAQAEALAEANQALHSEISLREKIEKTLHSKSIQQERLIESARSLVQTLDVRQVLLRIGEGAREILEADGCSIYMLEPDGKTLTPVVAVENAYTDQILAAPLDVDRSFTGQAVKARQGLIFNDAGSHPGGYQIPGTPEEDDERIIVAPFVVGEKVLGAMCMDRSGSDFTQEELVLAEAFAAYATAALENALAHDEIQREVQERRQAEAALRDSEERYRTLFNSVPVGLYRTNPEGQILEANLALAEMLGFKDPESLKQFSSEQFHVNPADRQRAQVQLEQEATLRDYELQLRRQDGRVIWCSDNFLAVPDSQGKTLYYNGSLEDITERKLAEEALQDSEIRYRSLIENIPVGVYRTTPGPRGEFLMANPAFLQLFGYDSEEELRQVAVADAYTIPEQRLAFSETLLEQGHISGKEVLLKKKDGSHFWGSVDARIVYAWDGHPQYFDCNIQDVTQRKRAEKVQGALYQIAKATNEADGLDQLFKGVHQVVQELMPAQNCFIALYDPASTMISYPYFADQYDPPPAPRKLDKSLTSYVIRHGQPLLSLPEVFDDLAAQGEVESIGTPSVDWLGVPLKTGDNVTFGALVVQTYDEGLRYTESDKELLTIISTQIALAIERKRAEEKLTYNAFHDELTGLPNRTLFMDRLEHAIKISRRRNDHWFAVLFLDLDRFKTINDTLGHVLGDQLLVSASHRLHACMRSADTVARFGGDEFVILLEDLEEGNDAIVIADRILATLIDPFMLAGHEVTVGASIGIVYSSQGYEKPEEVLRDADIAMYQAKSLGRGRYVVFNSAMRADVVAHIELEKDLRQAIEHQDFVLHYQPILALKNSKIIGFEALLRWQHPKRGLIPPSDFIPFAEESGLILPLGEWVLREACRQMSEWQRLFPTLTPLTISVNLSNKQFSQPLLFEQIENALEESGLHSSYLRLEITESVIMENAELTIATLNRLRQIGVQVHIDDFGTGYSSLVYLHMLPINAIKIDRSFVSGNSLMNNGLDIAQTIVRLAHELNMEAIAEGVETQDQLEKLTRLNCEYAQGFHISACLDNKAIEKLLKTIQPPG